MSLFLRDLSPHKLLASGPTRADARGDYFSTHRIGFLYSGRPKNYDALVHIEHPVNPTLKPELLAQAYAELVAQEIEKGNPQLFATFTLKPYSKDARGRPRFHRPSSALKKYRWFLDNKLRAVQGYHLDYLLFPESHRNGSLHIHTALSNVDLLNPVYAPWVEKQDKKGRAHWVSLGMEELAWRYLGRASVRVWGGLAGNLTAADYFSKDMFRWDKLYREPHKLFEASPRWGKRGHKRGEIIVESSLGNLEVGSSLVLGD